MEERRVGIAELTIKIEAMRDCLDRLTVKVDELVEDKQQLKGAVRMLKLLGAGVAAVAGFVWWVFSQLVTLFSQHVR